MPAPLSYTGLSRDLLALPDTRLHFAHAATVAPHHPASTRTQIFKKRFDGVLLKQSLRRLGTTDRDPLAP